MAESADEICDGQPADDITEIPAARIPKHLSKIKRTEGHATCGTRGQATCGIEGQTRCGTEGQARCEITECQQATCETAGSVCSGHTDRPGKAQPSHPDNNVLPNVTPAKQELQRSYEPHELESSPVIVPSNLPEYSPHPSLPSYFESMNDTQTREGPQNGDGLVTVDRRNTLGDLQNQRESSLQGYRHYRHIPLTMDASKQENGSLRLQSYLNSRHKENMGTCGTESIHLGTSLPRHPLSQPTTALPTGYSTRLDHLLPPIRLLPPAPLSVAPPSYEECMKLSDTRQGHSKGQSHAIGQGHTIRQGQLRSIGQGHSVLQSGQGEDFLHRKPLTAMSLYSPFKPTFRQSTFEMQPLGGRREHMEDRQAPVCRRRRLNVLQDEDSTSRSHELLAVLACLMCWPIGLGAIYYSHMSRMHKHAGNHVKANSYGKSAFAAGILGVILGGLSFVLYYVHRAGRF